MYAIGTFLFVRVPNFATRNSLANPAGNRHTQKYHQGQLRKLGLLNFTSRISKNVGVFLEVMTAALK